MSNVNNKIATAKTAIAGLVSLLIGRKATVKWGQNAWCSPEGVISLPNPKTGDADEVALLTRQAVHESGHVLETDFACLEQLTAEEKALFNVLEDARVERTQIDRLPGAALVLNRGLEQSLQVINESYDPANPEHAGHLAVINVLMRGWLKVAPHEAVVKSGAELLAKGDQVLGERGVSAVKAAVDQLPAAKSTSDVIVLARGLSAALRQPEPEEPQSGQEADGDPQTGSQEQEQPQGGAQADQTQAEQSDGAGQPGQQSPASQSSAGDQQDAPPQGGTTAGGEADAAETEEANPQGDASQESVGQLQAGSGTDADPQSKPQGDGGTGERSDNAAEQANAESRAGGSEPQGESQAGTEPSEASTSGTGAGQAAQQPEQGAGQQSKAKAAAVDLSAAAGMDLGTMLAMAYEAKFGAPDVSEAGQEAPMESLDEAEQVLERSLQRALANGQSLEEALAEVEASLVALGVNGDGSDTANELSDDELLAALGIGGGNERGTPVQLDLGVRLSGPISRLVRVFTKELQDQRRRPRKYAPAGAQVAVNRLWRLKRLGDPNVFRITTKVSGIDAAAKFLLDRSGSMRLCIQEAAEVALVSAQALERIQKVKTSIDMFPGLDNDDDSVIPLQPFGVSARQAASRLKEVDAGGGTPLAQALQLALPDLLKQRVQKRLLFVISDGIPNSPELAKLELKRAQLLGIEVFGIGIGPQGVAILDLIEGSVHINEVSELPDAMEKLFRGQVAYQLAA